MNEVLRGVVAEIASAPGSAAALTLYALMSTLEFKRAGYLFKLAKLRDLSVGQRRLAYGLIELMATDDNGDDAWRQAKREIDQLIRAS